MLVIKRKSDQGLHKFYDAICSVADTANITAAEIEKLVYTAFMHRLRKNRHMHSWVTRRELSGNIESDLKLAEAYEKEYGWQSSSRANGVTVNARIIAPRPNRPANRRPGVCQKAVCNVNGENSALLGAKMSCGFRKLQRKLATQFSGLSNCLRAVENFQHDQMRQWELR